MAKIMWNIVLLAEHHDLPGLGDILRSHNAAVTVIGVSTAPQLAAATENPGGNTRLVCFCTGTLVPAAVLDSLPGPSYNFHPGPPEYPGIFPAVFALYEGAGQFGATAHQLTAAVDGGPIVAVDRIDMPRAIDRLNLEALSRQVVTDLFIRLAGQLIEQESPLTTIDQKWAARSWTRKDFQALCLLPEDVSTEEFERRYRALGEGPEHVLRLQRFGRRFSLDPVAGDGRIYKGGTAVDEGT